MSRLAELEAIRLGTRLATTISADTIVNDNMTLVNEINGIRHGAQPHRRSPTLKDPAATEEIITHMRDDGLKLWWDGGPRSVRESRYPAAVRDAAFIAHKLAWAARRLIQDDLNPAAEHEFLTYISVSQWPPPSSSNHSLEQVYDAWRGTKTQER